MTPRKPRILIVEDVPAMQALLVELVAQIGGVSASARNCWEARLEAGRHRPDMVLLDEVLPGESSADLAEELVLHGIPFVLMTGVEAPTHPLLPGALGRLTKPGLDCRSKSRDRFAAALTRLLTDLLGLA